MAVGRERPGGRGRAQSGKLHAGGGQGQKRGIVVDITVARFMSGEMRIDICSDCGEKIMLPKADQPIHLTKRQAEDVEANHRAADQRSRFEQALFRLKNYVTDQKIAVPECFIS